MKTSRLGRRAHRLLTVAPIALGLLSVGCPAHPPGGPGALCLAGIDEGCTDAGPAPLDAGLGTQGSSGDAGEADAGPAHSGPSDGGVVDAGQREDAGTLDAGSPHLYGVLETDPAHLATDHAAGIRIALLQVGWGDYEPQQDGFDSNVAAEKRAELAQDLDAGMQVVLDLGAQYPPAWTFSLPCGSYVDQYGESYPAGRPGSGKGGPNLIFCEAVRDAFASYVSKVFSDLGTQFLAARVGFGDSGELKFPPVSWNGHSNCYWGFDATAQGSAPGLPRTLPACPVPGWIPGTSSPNHAAAAAFLDWYLGALLDLQGFGLRTVRASYPGLISVLYPSWGLRPGDIAAAIADDLDGGSSSEINGEPQAGLDFDRLVAGIDDPKVAAYSTWLDAQFGDDSSSDPTQWSPIHYLASRLPANPEPLLLWGENTGPGPEADLQLCFQRMQSYGLIGFNWAFDDALYSGTSATVAQFGALIRQYP
ncbi:MAG: hypothetical protein ACYCWW_14825 [Deltaproteobacteria bacterium]